MGSLTPPQIKRLAKLRDEQIISGGRKKGPVSECPNRRPRGTRSNSRPARGALVASARFYLNVDRC
jgi:hypothetical protein